MSIGATSVSLPLSAYDYVASAKNGVYSAKTTGTGRSFNGYSNTQSLLTDVFAQIASDGLGGNIFCRRGIYYFTSPTTYSSQSNRVGLYGERGTIFKANATPAETYMFGWYGSAGTHLSDFILNGIEFDYNYQLAPVSIKWVDHVKVENCYFHGSIHHSPADSSHQYNGLDVFGSNTYESFDAEISHNRFEDNWSAGLGLSYIKYADVHDNHCYNNCQDYPGGGGVKTDVGATLIHIHHNRIWGPTSNDGIYCGYTGAFTSDHIIDHNIIYITPDNGSGHYTAGIKTYVNDTIIDKNNIVITNAYNGSVGIASFGTGCTIYGNRIVGGVNGIVADDGSASGGPYTSDSLNTVISTNSISGTGTRGIYVYQDNVTLNNNRVYCVAGSSIVTHANAANTRLVGNDLKGSLANIVDGGTGTSNHCYWDKDGTYTA